MSKHCTTTLIVVWLLITTLTGCNNFKALPTGPISGIDESIMIGETEITLIEASIRNSMQTHYIMTYPAQTHVFYRITLSIEQEGTSAEEIMSWGESALQLIFDDTLFPVSQSQRIITGDNVQYKVDEDFRFLYVYFFEVPEDASFSEFLLQFPDNQRIPLGQIIILPEAISAQVIELHTVDGGGSQNNASAYHATVGGGQLNVASASHTTVSGGRENLASYFYATIGGGYANSATARDTVIAGGSRNTASDAYAAVGGGIQNLADAPNTTIAGGAYNRASDDLATISGGTRNSASGFSSTIGGGAGNLASDDQSTVSGGLGNQASGAYASIGGGHGNLASGAYTSIPGGFLNEARGKYSLAAGFQAKVAEDHPGVFLFADSTNFDFHSAAENEFAVRASGGVRLVTSVDEFGTPIAGSILPAGSGAWSTLSDRNLKDDINPIDSAQILEAIVSLPLSSWRYQNQDTAIRHMGPMAQDFYAAFEFGESDRHISTVDADGVALAGIQALHQHNQDQQALIVTQQSQISYLENRLSALEQGLPKYQSLPTICLILVILNILILTRFRFVER
jgi:hypothetical protein